MQVIPYYEADRATLYLGDCIEVMRGMADASVDAIVTDPPYELGFMGKAWDGTGIAYSLDLWREALRVLKPGGHLLAFGGTRTSHRMVCAIEDAGFEIRDSLSWNFGSGFPKSLNVSKAIDKAAGAERELTRSGTVQRDGYGDDWDTGSSDKRPRYDIPATDAARQWDGWGTALKPAHEPISLARKPLSGTVARNVQAHGTGAINIGGTRIGTSGGVASEHTRHVSVSVFGNGLNGGGHIGIDVGRWPANVLLGCACDGPGHEAECAVALLDAQSGGLRFAYVAKASRAEREAGVTVEATRRTDADSREDGAAGSDNPRLRVNARRNDHATVKPIALMRWLCRLVTPPGGVILDPFNGSGSTGCAAMVEEFRYIGIDLSAHYLDISRDRITHWGHDGGTK